MTLAVKDHIEFYGSPDLKEWIKLSEFGYTIGAHGGVWECPDLFLLKHEDGNSKWVVLVSINPGGPQGGSATQYFIGDFDGKYFLPQDTVTRWIDYGADNYAGVTWSDIPASDGRRLFIGWMSNWQYANEVPTVAWRSATTLPREVVLEKKSNQWELNFRPVKELAKIQQEPVRYTGTAALDNPLYIIEFDVEEDSQEFSLTLSNDQNEKVNMSVREGVFSFDRTVSGITDFNMDFPSVHQVDVNNLVIRKVKIFVDLSSVEVFVNDGERVVTELVFPNEPYNQITLSKKDPWFTVSNISSTLR